MFSSEILRQRLNYFAGEYESHITVAYNDDQFLHFRECCEDLGARALIIELSSAEDPVQPMLCKRHSLGVTDTLKDISNMIEMLSREFEVERVKVEAALINDGIPDSKRMADKLPADCYFEHHVKLELPLKFDELALRRCMAKYNGYLSRNPLSKEGVIQRRFVTQRFYQSTRKEAEQNLGPLLLKLQESDLKILQVIREFNIYDSNIARDAGWMS